MEITMTHYLIVCPLVFLAGLLDSIAGGGGLISLPAFMIAGVPPHMALGTNKMCSTMGTSMATYRFAKNGYIYLKKVIWFIAAALVGSTIGSNLTLLMNEKIVAAGSRLSRSDFNGNERFPLQQKFSQYTVADIQPKFTQPVPSVLFCSRHFHQAVLHQFPNGHSIYFFYI